MHRTLANIALLICLSPPVAVFAQPRPPLPSRIEISGALSVVPPTTGSAIDVVYEPALHLGGTPIESRARQRLGVDTRTGRGAQVGVAVFASRWVGLQFTAGRTSLGVAGAPGTHDSSLRYVSLVPPSYEPREAMFERTMPWPPASGSLDVTTVTIGAVARWTASGARVGGLAGGGLAGQHHAGEIDSVAYTQFILGGHSTLFPVTHRVTVGPVEDV